MPIGPKRRGSPDSMMQYTYFPRLAARLISARRPACTTRSDARRSTGRADLASAFGAPADPFGLAGFAVRVDPAFFVPLFGVLRGAWRPVRARPPFWPLVDALGIFAAPAGLLVRRRIEDLANLLHEVFGQTRLGDERIAAGALG